LTIDRVFTAPIPRKEGLPRKPLEEIIFEEKWK
jgi:hypothetical protein